MSWVQFPPPALILTILLSALLIPTIHGVEAEANASQEVISTTVLFNASGNNELSTSATPSPSTQSGSIGPFGSGIVSASFTSMPLMTNLTPTDDEWGASMFISGNGNVWMRMILETNTGVIGQVDSGPITLNGVPQEVLLFGDGFAAESIPKDSLLTLNYEVRGNTMASVTMHWGSTDTPSALGVAGDFVRPVEVQISDAGEVFDDGDGDYGRRNVQVTANIETSVALDSMMQGMSLWVKDGETEFEILNATVEGDSGTYLIAWEISELGNGSNVSVFVAWRDAEGVETLDPTVWEWVFPPTEPQSLLSEETLLWLQWSTAPLLLVVGYWLLIRHRRFCSEEEELDELDHRAFGLLIFSASCFFIAALNIMFFIVNHHIRTLGAKESQIILHLGLLALIFGAAGPLWGRLADRKGERRSLVKLAGFIGVSISLLMAPLSLWPFFFASIALMVVLGIQRLHFALASEWFPGRKGEAIGILYAFGYLATAIFAVVDGSIYERLGIWATCITSAVLIAIGTMVFLRIDINRIDRVSPTAEINSKSNMKILNFESKWVKWCLLGALLVAIPRGAVVLTSPRYIEIRGFDISMTSLFESWAIITLVLLYAFTGWVCDRYGAEKVLLASALGYGTLWSLFSIGLSPWLAVAIYLIPIVPLLLVSNDALLSRFSSLEERNRGLGMAGAAAYVGQAIGIGVIVALMSWLEGPGISDVDVYHLAYRSNIPLFALAVVVTWWLSIRISNESDSAIGK